MVILININLCIMDAAFFWRKTIVTVNGLQEFVLLCEIAVRNKGLKPSACV